MAPARIHSGIYFEYLIWHFRRSHLSNLAVHDEPDCLEAIVRAGCDEPRLDALGRTGATPSFFGHYSLMTTDE